MSIKKDVYSDKCTERAYTEGAPLPYLIKRINKSTCTGVQHVEGAPASERKYAAEIANREV